MKKERGQQTAPAMSHAPCEGQEARSGGNLKDRIALITGASRGIGQAVAKRFAAEGAHVILVARTTKGLEETDDAIRAAGGNATLVPLDLAEGIKIEELAAAVAERFGRLDVLVGNAGALGELTPLPHLAPELWQQVINVNLTANFHLIRCFDLLLKKSDAPRAMFVTSGITQGVFPYWGPYAASKAALESMVINYAAENKKTSLKANLIDPGIVQTRMRTQAMPGEDGSRYPMPDDITDVFVKLAASDLQETGKKFDVVIPATRLRRSEAT